MSKTLIIPILAVIISVMVFSIPDAKATAPFQAGDVFAGVGSGQIKHYTSSGVLVDTLDTTTGSTEQTGMCFDSSGNLYSTSFGAGKASKFNNVGSLLQASWGGPFSTHPESCVVDAAGHIFVSEVDGLNQILKYDATGTLLDSYSPNSEARGTDWIDLAADQKTMYYTSEGTSVKRYDISTKTQLPDFATGLSGPCYELRILSNGEVLVACSQQVYRLANTTGAIVHTYPLPAGETSFLFAMNINPDGNSFWTAGYTSGHISHIDTATGTLLGSFTATPNPFSVAGLAIFGQKTVGCEPNCPQPVTISTKLSSTSIILGNSFTDNATLAGVTANATGSITYSVYNSTASCNGTPLFTSTTGVTDAKATQSSPFTPTKIGTYNIQAVYSGDSHNTGARSLCSDEKVTVLQGTGGPIITTKLSSDTTYLVGPPVTDSAVLSGVTSDASGTVTYKLYKNNYCTGIPIVSSKVKVTNGVVPDSAPFQPKIGSYNVQAVYSGDAKNAGATSKCGSEPLWVKPLTVTTKLSNFVIYLGHSLTDSAHLLGATADAGGSFTYNFYSGDSCTGTPAFSSQVTVENGIVPDSTSFSPTQVGTYNVQAVYSGDTNNPTAQSKCGSEHFSVKPITIVTNLSVKTTTLGNSIRDSASLLGATSNANGTVKYNFYSGDTCDGTPVFSSIKKVTNHKVPMSAPFTPEIPGNYNAQAVYSGDVNNKGSTSKCGTEAFTVTQEDIIIRSLSMGQ